MCVPVRCLLYIYHLLLHNDCQYMRVRECVWQSNGKRMLWYGLLLISLSMCLIVYCCWYYPIWEVINCFFWKEYHSLKSACVCVFPKMKFMGFLVVIMLNGFSIVKNMYFESSCEEKNITFKVQNIRKKSISAELNVFWLLWTRKHFDDQFKQHLRFPVLLSNLQILLRQTQVAQKTH